MKTSTIGLIVVILVAGFVISNRMSYQDGLDEQVFRCKMIEEGTYPNVDGFFESCCKQSSERSVEVAK